MKKLKLLTSLSATSVLAAAIPLAATSCTTKANFEGLLKHPGVFSSMNDVSNYVYKINDAYKDATWYQAPEDVDQKIKAGEYDDPATADYVKAQFDSDNDYLVALMNHAVIMPVAIGSAFSPTVGKTLLSVEPEIKSFNRTSDNKIEFELSVLCRYKETVYDYATGATHPEYFQLRDTLKTLQPVEVIGALYTDEYSYGAGVTVSNVNEVIIGVARDQMSANNSIAIGIVEELYREGEGSGWQVLEDDGAYQIPLIVPNVISRPGVASLSSVSDYISFNKEKTPENPVLVINKDSTSSNWVDNLSTTRQIRVRQDYFRSNDNVKPIVGFEDLFYSANSIELMQWQDHLSYTESSTLAGYIYDEENTAIVADEANGGSDSLCKGKATISVKNPQSTNLSDELKDEFFDKYAGQYQISTSIVSSKLRWLQTNYTYWLAIFR